MLAAIGENLEDEDDNEVMGVVVNVRRGFYRIGLWTRTVGKALPGEQGKGRTFEQGKETLAKIEAEMRRIEQQSTAEVEKLLAATGKRIDGELQKLDAEMTNLKSRLDERFAALEKRLEAERAAAEQVKPAEPAAPADGASPAAQDAPSN